MKEGQVVRDVCKENACAGASSDDADETALNSEAQHASTFPRLPDVSERGYVGDHVVPPFWRVARFGEGVPSNV